MTGRELSEKLNYIGMEAGVRRLALEEKMASPEELAIMPELEVCDLVADRYELLSSDSEHIYLVKLENLEQVQKLVKVISR